MLDYVLGKYVIPSYLDIVKQFSGQNMVKLIKDVWKGEGDEYLRIGDGHILFWNFVSILLW